MEVVKSNIFVVMKNILEMQCCERAVLSLFLVMMEGLCCCCSAALACCGRTVFGAVGILAAIIAGKLQEEIYEYYK